MRFSEMIGLSVFMVLFFSMISGACKNISELDKRLHELKEKTDSLIFISESFSAACKGEAFSSFEEWEATCKSVWSLEEISWQKKEDGIFRAVWSGPYGSGEFYCKRQVKNVTDAE